MQSVPQSVADYLPDSGIRDATQPRAMWGRMWGSSGAVRGPHRRYSTAPGIVKVPESLRKILHIDMDALSAHAVAVRRLAQWGNGVGQ